MTERLYYADSHLHSFSARVLGCTKTDTGYEVELDRTAFFPEGGGQLADTGCIGQARVADVQEKDHRIVHYVNQMLDIGAEYDCEIDWEQRFRRMQNHTGEHIVSGLIHKNYGYNNIGFHMGGELMTIDFDGELSFEQLLEIERAANRVVCGGYRVTTEFPSPEKLENMEYRSKKELTENVRIVTIEGVDACACCAPHLRDTAEVGLIKILGSERRRRGGEGVRVSMLCGLDAYEDYAVKHNNAMAVSALLSAPQNDPVPAVERMLAEQERAHRKISELSLELARLKADAIAPTDGNICVFDDGLDEAALRCIVNCAVEKCGGLAAVFSGNDEDGYRYIIGSRSIDLRGQARAINAGIEGKGGGRPEMIQGSCRATHNNIKNFLSSFAVTTN